MAAETGEMVVLGRISGLYGVRGWVKVYSETEPRENILSYSPWYVWRDSSWQPMLLREGRLQGKGVVAHLEGIDDRDLAASLIQCAIAVPRGALPSLADGEYYWSELIGLQVVTREGVSLGTVDHLLETGANDVLVVKGERERLIPYTPGEAVLEVDLEGERLIVDWDPDF